MVPELEEETTMRNVIKTGIVAAVTALFVASVAVAGGQGPEAGQGQLRWLE